MYNGESLFFDVQTQSNKMKLTLDSSFSLISIKEKFQHVFLNLVELNKVSELRICANLVLTEKQGRGLKPMVNSFQCDVIRV